MLDNFESHWLFPRELLKPELYSIVSILRLEEILRAEHNLLRLRKHK